MARIVLSTVSRPGDGSPQRTDAHPARGVRPQCAGLAPPAGPGGPNRINANGELQAAQELRQAADILSPNPASLQLRYLQTLLELGADQNSTVVFPLPIDVLSPFLNAVKSHVATDNGATGDVSLRR